MDPQAVIIAADCALLCDGIAALLERSGRFRVAHRTQDGMEAVRLAREDRPDLLLLDLSVRHMPSNEDVRAVVQGCPPIGLVVLSSVPVPSVLNLAIDLSARAVVLKSSPAGLFEEALTAVGAGRCWAGEHEVSDLRAVVPDRRSHTSAAGYPRERRLTPREREIVAAVIAARCNKEIADDCRISETTVKHHLTRIFGKLGVSSRLELARVATDRGLRTDRAASSADEHDRQTQLIRKIAGRPR